MIDYNDIGSRIRAVRTEKEMTQERLAELVGVGTTHISHIETGNTVPSLKALIGIINALKCSADELLCIEIEKAKPLHDAWLSEELSDCSDVERRILADTLRAVKASLRKHSVKE